MHFQKERQGIKQTRFQPARLYLSKEGKYINLGAYGKSSYEKCLKAFGFDLEKYSYEAAGNSEEAVKSERGVELDTLFDQWFKSHTATEAIDILRDLGIAASVVMNCEDVMKQEHWQLRDDWVKYEDQTLEKEVTAFGFTPKLSETPGKVWRGAPRLGQDTERIMKELLDYSQEEIDAFKGKGVID